MAYNIGAKLSLDGQSEFKEALSQSARALRTLDSELNAVKETSGEGQSEIDALTQQQEILKNKGEILSDTMKKVEEELKKCTKEYGENNKVTLDARKKYADLSTQIAKNNKSIAENQEKLNKATDNSDSLKGALQKLWEKLKNVKNGFDSTSDSMDNAGDSAKKFEKNTTSALELVKKAVAAIAVKELVQNLKDLALESAATVDELNTLSTTTGIAADRLQELQYAAKFVDVSVDTMTKSMREIGKKMGEAKNGSAEAAKAFDTLGVSLYSGVGQLRDSSEVWEEVLRKLGSITNETERTNLAMQLMGEEATALNGIMGEAGVNALKQYSSEARRMGVVMSGDTMNSLQELNDANDRLNAKFQSVKYEIAAELAPTLIQLANRFSMTLDVLKPFIQDGLQWLLDHGKEIATGIGAVTIGLAGFKIVATLTSIMSAFNTSLAVTNSTMWANPASVIAAAVAASVALLAAALYKWAENSEKVVASVGDVGGQIKDGVKDAANAVDDFNDGITDAIESINWSKINTLLKKNFTILAKNSADAYSSELKYNLQNIDFSFGANSYSGRNSYQGFASDIVNGIKSFIQPQTQKSAPFESNATINITMDGRKTAEVLWDPLNNVAKQKGVEIINAKT